MSKTPKSREKAAQKRIFAYLRVSTGDQDLKSQQLGILEYAKAHDLQPIKFVAETVSGTVPVAERTLGKVLIPQMVAGSTLVVSEISRLGRSVVDILSTLKLLSEGGVAVHVVKSGQQLDGSLTSKILTTVLGLAAEIERELIRQRTKEGQQRARARGVHIGRPRLTDDSQRRSKLDIRGEEIKKLAGKGVNVQNLSRVFDCTWKTMRVWLDRHAV